MTLAADVLVRDENGNMLYKAEMPGVPYDHVDVIEAHISDSGTVVLTLAVR